MTNTHTNFDNEKSTTKISNPKSEKYKFIIDLIKWFLSSVVIVIVTMIIDAGFRERSAGIQEMQAYDEYVEIILKADNIVERWNLAEYFSTVTPTVRLRERWMAYKDSIKNDYLDYLELKKQLDSIDMKNINTLSPTDKEVYQIQKKLEPFELKLNNAGDHSLAEKYEQQGFASLLNKDVENAIIAFRNSEQSYNGYHQVYEIANYLNENKSKLKDSNSEYWNEAFRTISTKYSWKMPLDIKNRLLKN
jgi:hypothetical protein